MRELKARLVGPVAFLCALYLRQTLIDTGKFWVWNAIVRRRLLWRDLGLPMHARARFGATFEGSLRDIIHRYLYFFGVWEPAMTALLRSRLSPGDTVIDVGANVGAHTLLAAHLVGPRGVVHAIEASPSIFATLTRNIARNRAGNVRSHNVASSDRAGEVTVFRHAEDNPGRTTIVADVAARDRSVAEATIPALPLRDIVGAAALEAARFIKIDIEGAEWPVLQDLLRDIGRLRPDVEIAVEVSLRQLEAQGASLALLCDAFAQHGFRAFEVPNAYEVEAYLGRQATDVVPLQPGPAAQRDILFTRADPRGVDGKFRSGVYQDGGVAGHAA